MRSRWIVATIAAGMLLSTASIAQPPGDNATADDEATGLSVSVEFTQAGQRTTSFEKGAPVEAVATIAVDMAEEARVNVLVSLDIADELNIESEDVVRITRLGIDNTGDGRFAPQSALKPRARLRFAAPEGAVGVADTQRVKWVLVFKANAAAAPFSVSAAAVVPPSSDIVAEERTEKKIKVKTALSVQQLWADGGLFMWPLGLALILGIAFALERMWTLTFAKIDAQKFSKEVESGIRSGGIKKGIEVCDTTRGPVAAVIREGLLRVDQGVEHVEKAIASAGAIEGSFLQRGLVVLASVTTIAPMLGFLGTVWGMILAFKAIAEAGDVKPSVVADGISQALITTACGLVIAIIVQTFHNFVISRINRIIIDMEETSTSLVDLLLTENLSEASAS
jgi:biopolymer transport protein ExbB